MDCRICPRLCGADRREGRGFCGVGDLPVLARAALHPWEEPCISGKNGSGTVFFSGCNLRCVFCQNYDVSTGAKGRQVTVARLRQIYEELIQKGAHNINLVTPSHYAPAIVQSLQTPLGVPVVWNSNGYESVETLRTLAGKVQVYLPDLKYLDGALSGRYSGAADYPRIACDAIDEMVRQRGPYVLDSDGMLVSGVMIRHLILPGQLDNTFDVIDYVAAHFPKKTVLFSLMCQYVPCGRASEYPEINRILTQEEYDRAESYLRFSPIDEGYMQDMLSASEAYIPPFDFQGV